MQELKQRIPNLHGAKYTGPNMYELGRVLDQSAVEWTIFSGMDEQCLFAMMVGAPGSIGSTFNFMPGLYRDMRTRFQDGRPFGSRSLLMAVTAAISAPLNAPLNAPLSAPLSAPLTVPMSTTSLNVAAV